ncbi:MAG: hypothetical protein F6K65_27125 [Moorea sp. SIO3C2]|nr:hypothetical protein [Moorena sp. SIO3C2]
MPVLPIVHRPDACSTNWSQARCLFYQLYTGKMPILPIVHRQDACSTNCTQARCLFYQHSGHRQDAYSTNIVVTGKMPILPIVHRQDAYSTKNLIPPIELNSWGSPLTPLNKGGTLTTPRTLTTPPTPPDSRFPIPHSLSKSENNLHYQVVIV